MKIEDAQQRIVRTAAVYEDDAGNLYEVDFDTCAENPVDMWDGAELCVLAAPHGEQLNDPGSNDCDAMWELNGFHADNKRLPSTKEWARLCPDYPVELTECLVEDFSR